MSLRPFSLAVPLIAVFMCSIALLSCGGGSTLLPPQQTTQNAALDKSDVDRIVTTAAASVSTPIVIAVTDRAGRVLAVYRKANAPTTAEANFGKIANSDDVAVALARTAAFFSNNEAPLSSRTVRFISGIHFPPGVSFTPNAALYGIENTNRGCPLNGDLVPGQTIPQAKSLNGQVGLGVLTGKRDVNDSDPTAVNPGGVPLFKNGELVGGIGVAGAGSDVVEFAAFSGARAQAGPNTTYLPIENLPAPGAVLIDGIALPFVLQTTPPPGVSAGAADGSYPIGPMPSLGPVPEGDLVVPRAGALGGLTAAEVRSIIDAGVARANRTRAVIRLPLGRRTRMVIALVDLNGTILALNRMPDATVFSIDVAIAKARNMTYFNKPSVNPADMPGVPPGTSVTNRTISFGSQPLFPPGIDNTSPGPFFNLYVNDVTHPCSQGSQPTANAQQSGIVFFPGSAGLYRDGKLIGGLGVSGDGVEQDDYVTAGALSGFAAPDAIRADNIILRDVRLPYFKFPRVPE